MTSSDWEDEDPAPERHANSRKEEVDRARRDLAIARVAEIATKLRAKCTEHSNQVRSRMLTRSKTCMASIGTPTSADDKTRQEVIIFDWDDTLLPTWYLKEVVDRCLPEAATASIPDDSHFKHLLTKHAMSIRDILVAATRMGKVAIVTLAQRGWVENSAMKYLPDLDLPNLLHELKIPVYYAREHVTRREKLLARIEEGVDLNTVAKANAMSKCIRKICCSKRNRSVSNVSVTAVGDSIAEADALKEVMWGLDGVGTLCKTVKLLEEPNLETLGMELSILASWLPHIVSHRDDVDIDLAEASDTDGFVFDCSSYMK
jgi:hypothetical protein